MYTWVRHQSGTRLLFVLFPCWEPPQQRQRTRTFSPLDRFCTEHQFFVRNGGHQIGPYIRKDNRVVYLSEYHRFDTARHHWHPCTRLMFHSSGHSIRAGRYSYTRFPARTLAFHLAGAALSQILKGSRHFDKFGHLRPQCTFLEQGICNGFL